MDVSVENEINARVCEKLLEEHYSQISEPPGDGSFLRAEHVARMAVASMLEIADRIGKGRPYTCHFLEEMLRMISQ